MKKRIFLLLFTAALISLWLLPSYEISGSKETTFLLSKNPEENTAIVLQDRNLLIRNLPETETFNYVMLKLVDVQDTLPIKKCKNRKEYDVNFNLQDVPNGSYFVEIYSASEQYTTYVSYLHGQSLCIQITDSSVDFVESPVLVKNQELFDANKQDSETLAYYLEPSPKIQSNHPTIIEQAKNITAGISTDYDKVKVVHDWVCENIWYDYDALSNGTSDDKTVMETFVSRKGVCTDYAFLTAALLRAVGVPTKVVAGYVLDTSAQESWTEDLITSNQCNHAWNEAYVDGRWIILDTTYDSNNTFKNKIFSTDTGMKNTKYFDITIEFLSTDRYIVPSEIEPVEYR